MRKRMKCPIFELVTTYDDDPELNDALMVSVNGMLMHPDTFLSLYNSEKTRWHKMKKAKEIKQTLETQCIKKRIATKH